MSHPHPGLTAPPALPKRGLRIIGLGGLGEIGRNMTVFEYAGRLLIVDCGVLFPEPDQPGVDLILPDFSYLDGRLGQVEAVVLTHAHEDHIGAHPVPAPRAPGPHAGRLEADPRPGQKQARRAQAHARHRGSGGRHPSIVRSLRA